MILDCGTSFLYVVNVRNACDCLCYSQIFAGILALIQWRKNGKKIKGCNRFPDFLCVFQTDFVERKITALENITFCVSLNLSFRVN